MCHVTRLNNEERERLNRMSQEYRNKLEMTLEDFRDGEGRSIPSTRTAVKPIFEKIYAAWLERESSRITARTFAEDGDPETPTECDAAEAELAHINADRPLSWSRSA